MAERFRKKPVEIEAMQFNGAVESANRILGWIGSNGGDARRVDTTNPEQGLIIRTLEGDMRADVGDWIVRGIKDEFYPVKPDIFAGTYEPAAEPGWTADDEAGELGADAYDLDIAAAALRRFADLIDNGPAAPSTSLPPAVYSQLARENADAAEAQAERLRARIPAPDSGHCEVIDVDGQPVPAQADADMPAEVRDVLEDVIRTVQRNHGGGQL